MSAKEKPVNYEKIYQHLEDNGWENNWSDCRGRQYIKESIVIDVDKTIQKVSFSTGWSWEEEKLNVNFSVPFKDFKKNFTKNRFTFC